MSVTVRLGPLESGAGEVRETLGSVTAVRVSEHLVQAGGEARPPAAPQ